MFISFPPVETGGYNIDRAYRRCVCTALYHSRLCVFAALLEMPLSSNMAFHDLNPKSEIRNHQSKIINPQSLCVFARKLI